MSDHKPKRYEDRLYERYKGYFILGVILIVVAILSYFGIIDGPK